MSLFQPKQLTSKDEEFCAVAGVIGSVLSIACLFQNWYILSWHWLSIVVSAVFIFSTVAFILLVKKSHAAFICICISALLLFAYAIFLILSIFLYQVLIFSWLFTILLLYNITIPIIIFANGLHTKLTIRQQLLEEEAAYWNDKL